LNAIRFSTQYHDDFTDDDKYLFRDLRDGRWPNRDPIGELGWIVVTCSKDANLLADGPNPYHFVANNPMGKVDLLGLQKWCGTCETYGAGIAIGLQFLECYLTTPCDRQCKYEYVHVKAWFGSVSASPLPVNYTQFRTCFETPEEQDHTAFNGAARFVTITVSAGVGKTGGKVILADAESEGVDDTSGIDWSASFGAGRSWVRSHYTHSCK
jgi:hypothetical protein